MRTTALLLAATLFGCGGSSSTPPPDMAHAGGNRDLGGSRDMGSSSSDQGVSQGDMASTGCGTCPNGYSCGSANGHPVCRAASGIPLFSRVIVVLMENTSLSTLQKATNTPYLAKLAMDDATSGDYHGVTHPSLPNYIALTSGDTQGIACDCQPTGGTCNSLNCNKLLSSCGCAQDAMNLADTIEAAGKTWKAYAEDMGTACNLTNSGGYATRHVPFLYYNDVQNDSARCAAHAVDYSQLATDLKGTLPDFVFVAPNLTDDMHDPVPAGAQNLANGDTWLSTNLPPLIQAAGPDGLVVVVWDEDDLSGLLAADDPIPIFVISDLAKKMYVSPNHADHYSLLATIEDGLDLPRLGPNAGATPLADFFPSQ